MKDTKTTLILTGMHRSGTSLLANWLHHSGLAMGDLLIKKGPGNEEGHFEDWDFVHFHNDLLHYNGLDYLADARLNYEINDYFQKRADYLINFKNESHSCWGWKDPRTSLFLNLWHKKVSNPRYVFVYRPYSEIAESLYRREIDKLRTSKIFPLKKLLFSFQKKEWIKKYTLSYINHYKRIISFCQELEKEDYIFISRDTFIHNNEIIFQFLRSEWKMPLKNNSFDTVYKSKLAHDLSASKHHQIAANLVESTLKQLEEESLNRLL